MLDSSEERNARLAKMAYLYFIEKKNQYEVAEAMGMARPMVSRMLKEAEDAGIVQMRVSYPTRSARLEREFRERFGLAEPMIYVVNEDDPAAAKAMIGRAAASYLSERVSTVKRIAISWGSTLFEMIKYLEKTEDLGIEVIQLIGATGLEHNPNDGPLIARCLAEKLSAKVFLLHAPLVVESEYVAASLMKDRVVRETLDRAAKADIAFVGVGSLERDRNSLFRAGYLSEDELSRIRDAGGVGDTCAQFFDARGRLLDIDVNRRIIGLPADDLAKVQRVIAVTLGAEKVPCVLGALRGGRIKGLITDHRTAEGVLELDSSGAEGVSR